MKDQLLCEKLEKVTALKKDRLAVALWVLQQPGKLPALIRLGLAGSGELSVKACWVLDMVARQELNVLFPYAGKLVSGIEKLQGQSAIRPVSRVCEQLLREFDNNSESPLHQSLGDKELKALISAGFNWLQGDNKVAARANAMGCLFYLGKIFPWIHAELETILHRGYLQESAGFRARARMVLSAIQQFRVRATGRNQ
jgi:hypothetical protein